MKRTLITYLLVAAAAILSACGTSPDVIKHQASAKAQSAKWKAKAEIAKWGAVKELAKSGSDVGRVSAGMAIQADTVQSGAREAVTSAAGDYTQDPSALDYVVGISREARGWVGLKFGRDVALDNNRTQREIRFNDNATYLGFGREIGETGRTGMSNLRGLGSEAISKIPSHSAAPAAPTPAE